MSIYRVALCFSGQARTWEYCVKNIKHFFSRDIHPENFTKIQYDYFIHTWDTNTYRPNTQTQIYTDVAVPEDTAEKIKAAYNPVDFCMDPWNGFLERTNSTRNFDGMFYSFMKSLHMKRKYELANDFEYDLVIKIRLDTIYNPYNHFVTHTTSPLMCYSCTPVSRFPIEFHYNNFDDVFFYGDSKTMDLVANIYNIHKQKRDMDLGQDLLRGQNPEFYYGPGCLLYKNLVELSIHPFCFNSFPWYVVRQNVADSGLDPFDNWAQVKTLCMDWYQ